MSGNYDCLIYYLSPWKDLGGSDIYRDHRGFYFKFGYRGKRMYLRREELDDMFIRYSLKILPSQIKTIKL